MKVVSEFCDKYVTDSSLVLIGKKKYAQLWLQALVDFHGKGCTLKEYLAFHNG